MGKELKWVAVSEDGDKLLRLRDYIFELDAVYYGGCRYTIDIVNGITLYQVKNRYYLFGTWKDCTGRDLGFYANLESKNSLFEDVMFFEEDNTPYTWDILRYIADSTNECGALSRTEKVGRKYHGAFSVIADIPDVWFVVHSLFTKGRVEILSVSV